MPKKPKFKPRITVVKLNPEQAVLTCNCYSEGLRGSGYSEPEPSLWHNFTLCVAGGKTLNYSPYNSNTSAASS
jgi:hypothetical protein